MGSRKRIVIKEYDIPEGFLPIGLIEPTFEQASHVVSLSEPFLFFNSKIGEIEGRVQRYDRNVGGELLNGSLPNDFLTLDNLYLHNVTHFKTI